MKTFLKQFKNTILLLSVIGVSSCASQKDIAYFQDEPLSNAVEGLPSNFEIRFKTDDLLTIDVSAIDPDVARPFNLPAVSYNANVISAQGNLKMQTYLIDGNGNIEFPVLGTITLGGLTRSEANSLMKEKLSEYIKDPIVNIRLANFTITVLGEVSKPGTFTIQDERISLTEALGLAGDLTIYGKRDNIFLIREIDGKKRYSSFDLTSINVVNSQSYYLTQNDVIYVEPNRARVRQASYNQNNSIIISAVATLATIAAILIK
ncbi:MAG: polysaccharide biosynthesis/export family protein [Bacteroidia bacterium]|nr:polysaccharide biosynthesis/export family protein [Bacteroidia bacterium]MBT8279503.1 polysaccharide biosynthesis/export family protein [Bacteroidia bacterium]NND26516.1 polysaccharide export protein [Flavobacteriaceae bacterium]NNK59451.1 polysaccharide export protein [Flavobacteriaceae bacterium]NNL32739.1 polysaccharide export protein [Flavobacteriaceae bacterium]